MRIVILTATLLALSAVASASTTDELARAAQAIQAGEFDEAVRIADAILQRDAKNVAALRTRAAARSGRGLHREAVADYDTALATDPLAAELFDARGSEHFMLGQIDESIADFDRFLAARPDQAPYHWKRGISLYYAGRFDEGRRQFEAYQTIDSNDVENAVWCYLCAARSQGRAAARQNLLPIGNDPRVPLMTVYALFRGQATAAAVLQAAETGQPSEAALRTRRFYAHLYLGLYFESEGETKRALEHLTLAAEQHKVPGYMCETARVHVDLLRRKGAPKG